jgi:diphthamide synthase (EF-2-diphthine--ammonia ligase)
MNISASNHIESKLSGLAGRLVSSGVLSEEQATEATHEASKLKMSLVRYLVESLDVDSHELAELASQEFGVPLFDVAAFDKASLPEKIVAPELMAKHHAIPLYRRGNRLFVAVSDPTNLAALDEFKFATGISTDAVLVDEKALARLLGELLDEQDSLDSSMGDLGEDGEYDLAVTEGSLIGDSTAERIKQEVGCAISSSELREIDVRGRHLAEGIPKSFTLNSDEIRGALEDPLESILRAIKMALEQSPPELAADIAESGIVLTGGGALLRDLDKRIAAETELPVIVAEDPLTCVARGGGRALELMDRHALDLLSTE